MELKQFARLVRDMRTAQCNYFSAARRKAYSQMKEWLAKSKELEKQVDEAADAIENGEQLKIKL